MKKFTIMISLVVGSISHVALADEPKLEGKCAMAAYKIADQLAAVEDSENGTNRTLERAELSQQLNSQFPESGWYFVSYKLADVTLEHQVAERSFEVILNSDCSPNVAVVTQNSRKIPGLLR